MQSTFSQSCRQARRQTSGPTLGLLFGGKRNKPKVVVKPATKPAAELSFSLSFFEIKYK